MSRPRSTLLEKQIAATRRSVKTIDRSLRRLASMTAKEGNPRRARLSAKARASLVVQGRYMGYTRQLKLRHKAQAGKGRYVRAVSARIGKTPEFAER